MNRTLKEFWKRHRRESKTALILILVYELADQLEQWLEAVGLKRVNDWLAISEHAWVLCVLPEQQTAAEKFCRRQRAERPVDGLVALCPTQREGGERAGGNCFFIKILKNIPRKELTKHITPNQLSQYWRLKHQKDLERLVAFHRTQVFKLIRHESNPMHVHAQIQFPNQLSKLNVPDEQQLLLETDHFDLAPHHWLHILKAAAQTPSDKRVIKNRRRLHVLFGSLVVLFTLFISGFWLNGFLTARHSIQQIEKHIQQPSLQKTEQTGVFYPSVTHWQSILSEYRSQLSMSNRAGLWLGNALVDSLSKHYHYLLKRQFLPVITAQLEQALRESLSMNGSTWGQFELLRAYLMLGEPKHRDFSLVVPVFERLHHAKSFEAYEDWNGFESNLSALFGMSGWRQLLKRSLIQDARDHLHSASLASQLYHLATMKSEGTWLLRNELNESQAGLFDLPKRPVPRYFTRQGEAEFIKQLQQNLSNHLSELHWVLGGVVIPKLDRGIHSQLKSLYQENALSVWSQMIEQIKIAPAPSLSSWIISLSLFKASNGPIYQISKIALSHLPNAIRSEWQPWFVWMKHSKSNFKTWHQAIQNIQKQLMQVQSSEHPGEQALYALKQLQAGKNKAFEAAISLAKNLPAPLSRWLNSIIRMSRSQLLQVAQKGAMQAWHMQVSPRWNIVNKQFPFDRNSDQVASFSQVKLLLKPGGVFDQWTMRWGALFRSRKIARSSRAMTLVESWQSILFKHNAKFAFTWRFKPISMSANIASFIIQSGSQEILYQHGPTNPQAMTWPTHQPVVIRVVNLHGRAWEKRFTGPWAIFRVLTLFQGDSIKSIHTPFGALTGKMSLR